MTGAVSVALQKGGVGKTTVAVNLADRLAADGDDVVLVDVDQQGNATEAVGRRDAYTADAHLGDVFDDEPDVEAHDLLLEAAGETNFDVLPAHRDLDEVEAEIKDASWGPLWLRREVVEPLFETHDWVVIDTPPSIGPLSDSALIASRHVVVPLLMSESSVSGLERMVDQQLQPIRQEVDVDIAAIVPNRLAGDNEEKRIIGQLEESAFAQYLPEFARSTHFDDPESPGPGIRQRVQIKRAVREGVPLSTFDPDNDMLERYDDLAEVVRTEVSQDA